MEDTVEVTVNIPFEGIGFVAHNFKARLFLSKLSKVSYQKEHPIAS